MPVAVAPIDGQTRATSLEFILQRQDQLAILFVDRALAAKLLIVLGNFQHSLVRDVLATQHIFQEGNDVGRLLGAAKGNNQQGVNRLRRGKVHIDPYLDRQRQSVSSSFTTIARANETFAFRNALISAMEFA